MSEARLKAILPHNLWLLSCLSLAGKRMLLQVKAMQQQAPERIRKRIKALLAL